jgi:DNA-binding response OmpR family regulator
MTTILFADDSRSIREYCKRELEDDGYRVVVARDGSEALRLTSRHRPDLVILDICMPGIDGLEVVTRIRATQPDLPVILFTSFDDVCARDERAWSATACVEKREDLRELKNVVAAALRSRRQSQPYRVGLPPAAPSASSTAQPERSCADPLSLPRKGVPKNGGT